MLKALLVDLDGTLVDTHAANLAAYRQAFLDCGMEVEGALLAEHVGRHAWRTMLSHVVGPVDDSLAQKIAGRKRTLYPEFFDRIAVNRVLVDLLQAARPPLRSALVTSASHASCRDVLQALSLVELFDHIITSDDCDRHKPDPLPYQIAAARLGVTPDECLAFEDSDVGIAAAKSFGAQCMQVRWAR